MKSRILLFVLFFSTVLFAQEEEMMEEEDDRKFSGGHFAGFDIYMSQFMNEQGDMNFDTHPYWENNEVKSIGLNYNVFDLKFPIMGSKLGITTGFGVGLQSFSLRNNYVLQHTADTIFAVSDTVFQFTINKLNVASISIPLLLDFNFNETFQKSYYMAVGVIGSYNYGARQRTTGTVGSTTSTSTSMSTLTSTSPPFLPKSSPLEL